MDTNKMDTNKMDTNKMDTKVWVDSLFNPVNNRTEKIKERIIANDLQFIINGICYLKDDSLILDFKYFKYFAQKSTYPLITQIITNKCDLILQKYPQFSVHLNVSSFNIAQLDNHRTYLAQFSQLFANKYPDTLKVCYVYNASFVFSKLFDIISLIVDKDTLTKIHLIHLSI
jgi:hypothetical protein